MKRFFTHIGMFIAAMLFVALLFPNCETEEDGGDPPVVPPKESLVMNMSDFNSNDTSSTKSLTLALDTNNWVYAAINVGVWNFIIAVGLLVPVASFVESFNHLPTYDADSKSWDWEYNFINNNHSARLNGKIVGDNVQWKMYISKNTLFEQYSNFLWFSGESQLDGNGGTWTFYHSPNIPVEWLDITWSKTANDSIGDIKYTNVKEGDENEGGYIHYGLTTPDPYDAYYDIYDAKNDKLIEIKWNRDTGEGRVKDPVYFGKDAWKCWNEYLQNVECE